MKRFQRASAFLLALVLVVGLLPAGLLSLAPDVQAQADSAYVHASYTATPYVADGDVDLAKKPAYRRTISLSNGQSFSVVWDQTNLYIAASADITELKINAVDATPDGAVKNEVLISLSELGIEDLTKVYTFSVKVGDLSEAWSGKLVFDASVYETKSYTPGTSSSYKETVFAAYGEYYFNGGWSVELDSYYWNGRLEDEVATSNVKDGKFSNNHRDIYYPTIGEKLYSDPDAPTIVEFDLKIDQLPAVSKVSLSKGSRAFVSNGLSITITDDDGNVTSAGKRLEAIQYGFYHYQGNLMFTWWDNTAKAFQSEAVCAYSEAEGKTFHIRAALTYNPTAEDLAGDDVNKLNDKVSAEYYINGKLIASAKDAKIFAAEHGTGHFETSKAGVLQILGQTSVGSYNGTDESRIDIILSNVSAAHVQPGLEVLKQITSIGTVTAENMEIVSEIRLAYDKLEDAQKALVTNLDALADAEAAVRNIPYIHASFADTAITVDGNMDLSKEPAYRRTIMVNGKKVSAAWDGQGNLYLAAEETISELKVNGKPVTADAKEVKTSLASVGVVDLSAKYTLSFKLGDTAVSGVLVLDGIIFSKTCAAKTAIANGATISADGWTATLYTYEENATSTALKQDLYYPNMNGLYASVAAPTVLEMDVTVDQLPSWSSNLTWSNWTSRSNVRGLNIVVMDDDNKINETWNLEQQNTADRVNGAEAMLTGIYRSGDKLYLAYPYNTGTTGAIEVVEIDTYTEGKTYHLRIEYSYAPNTGNEEQAWKNTRREKDKVQDGNNDDNNNVSVKYYINGKLVSVKEDVKKYNESGWVSSGNNIIQINAVGLDNEAESTKLQIGNLSSTHAQPGLEVVKSIAAMGKSPDKEAVLAVRAAYEALDDAQKALVSNLAALEAAEVFWSKVVYVHANAAAGITLDGTLENAYRMNVSLTSDLKVGAAWDLNYLYLGIRSTGGKVSEMTGLNINGVAVTGVAVEKEEVASADGKSVEYRIPLEALGITVDTACDLAFNLGDLQWSGKLVLSTEDYGTVILSGSYGAVVDKTSKKSASLISNKGTNSGANQQLASMGSSLYKLEGLAETATVFEFDVKVNEMPDNANLSGSATNVGRSFCQGGLGITFRDQDPTVVAGSTNLAEAFFVALCKKDGIMMLAYWDNDANNGAGAFVTTAAGETEDGHYHIRVEYLYPEDVYSNDIGANYYVNGRLVATAQSVKQSGGSKSSSGKGINFIAYNGTDGTNVDVEVSNVSVSHAKGLTYMEKQLDETTPNQTNIVLQLGADKSQMNFTWFSKSEAQGVIKYAEESKLVGNQLPAVAASATATRTESLKTGYVGNKVTITGLKANTVYYYQIINGEDETELRSFKTGADGNFSFAFAGDPQIGRGYGSDSANNETILSYLKNDDEHWERTLNQMVTAPEFAGIDFLMSAGDQTNTHLGEYAGHEAQFDAYSNHDVLLGIPTVTVLGNHDADSYAIYDQHFNQPNMLINPETNNYYGATYTSSPSVYLQSADYYFVYNNVLFLVLNTNTYYGKNQTGSAEHLAFIDRVMAETAGQTFDWTITLYHQSPYGSSYHRGDDRVDNDLEAYAAMRAELIPKLYEVGVDMILSGHDHCYTRTYVLKPGTANGAYDGSYVIQNQNETLAFGNADGILHVVGGTASASQVNAVENEKPEMVVTATANTRMLSKIEVTADSLSLVTYNLGTQLSDNITEIDRFTITNNADTAVETAIAAIGTVTLEDETAIEAARAAYEALSPQLKKRVSNLDVLAAAEEALVQAKQEAADKETQDKAAAAAVDALIDAIGNVTLDSLDAIVAAEDAYNDLTEDQKALVENHLMLIDARAAYETLKAAADKVAADKAAAAAVDALINALPGVNELKLTDKAQVGAARAAYATLTADAAQYVAKLSVLEAAEAKIAQLQAAADKETADRAAAAEVDALINALPAENALQLTDKAQVGAARAAYATLTADAAQYVAKLSVLEAAEAKIAQLQAAADKETADKAAAKAVDEQIAAIGTVTYSKANAIATVRNAYNDLSDAQKAFVENLETLTNAEAKIAQLQAQIDTVEAKIAAIGEVTLSDAEAIDQAKTAFEALAADQQAAVENATVLTAAQAALKALQDAVTAVINQIDAIGTVTLESLADIEAAEAAYDALTDEQKALVTNHATLTEAREEYEEQKATADQAAIDQAAANDMMELIEDIGTVTLDSKTAIEAAEAAYAALTVAQKALVNNYADLTAARAAYDQLVAEKEAADKAAADQAAADAVKALIEAIGTVTLESEEAIEAAEAAYAALTADQKALVTNYADLTAARAAYDQLAAAEKEAADKAAAAAAIAKIEAIGTVTLESKLSIEAARVAYNALTEEQKALVSAEFLLKLTNAETALKALETPEEPPKTGDTQVVLPFVLLIGLSVAGLAVVLTGKKKFF